MINRVTGMKFTDRLSYVTSLYLVLSLRLEKKNLYNAGSYWMCRERSNG